MTSLNKIPKSTFTLPTATDRSFMPFWTTEQQNQHFMLQKAQQPTNTLIRNVFSTITNLFDAKHLPYRILFQREENAPCFQIAVSNSEVIIESAWDWIQVNMLPELEEMQNPFDKEAWVAGQLEMVIQATIADNGTDDLLQDDTIRNASRTFRQTFDVSPNERLVNYYSCSYNSRQGWMYISENYLAFYSYLVGFELKLLIELKDIKDIYREPIRKIFRRSIRVTSKNDQEYLFANIFRHDEVYGLLVQLTGDSVHKLLKNSNSAAFKNDDHSVLSERDALLVTQSSLVPQQQQHLKNNSLKNILEYRKKNEDFRRLFRLSESEEILASINVVLLFEIDPNSPHTGKSDKTVRFHGTFYLSQNFLVFDRSACTFILPLYTVTRFVRVNKDTYSSALEITTWHNMTRVFQVDDAKITCEDFCDTLKANLQANVGKMKGSLRQFLMTCKSEDMLQTPGSTIRITEPIGGLGLQFGYRSDTTPENEIKKMNNWKKYFTENGRNLTLARLPIFSKLVNAGLPDNLRGEIWEVCSGSIYLRFDNKDVYENILEAHKEKNTEAMDDIEKDLHRSLPEYPAYQDQEGIYRLRRVLTAYSWHNSEIGYCQAMNIVTSSLLIYMSEEQTFWTLNILVDQLCPGYYSSSMYGALLDQVVLENLAKEYLPEMTDHFREKDIQLSVACLPWFLTLFINSVPLPFAFRILDRFFMDGPKILFQMALGIFTTVLKNLEKELLNVDDDSELLMVAKGFFASLSLPNGEITKEEDESIKLEIFNNLTKSADEDFSKVTSEKIINLRKQNELKIIGGVESFTKRKALRSIKNKAYFGSEDISIIYDYYFGALYYAKEKDTALTVSEMDLTAFTKMLENMTVWAKLKNANHGSTSTDSENFKVVKKVLEAFIARLFGYFKSEVGHSGITLQDTITKLSEILRGDIMSKTAFYFALYDDDHDGVLNNSELDTMITQLYWLMSSINIDSSSLAWHTIQTIITLSAEETHQKDTIENLIKEDIHEDFNSQIELAAGVFDASYFVKRASIVHNALLGPEAPDMQVTLPSLRMIIITEDRLDQFIQVIFPQSFKLEKAIVERQKGLGHEIFEALFMEGKKLASNIAAPRDPNLLSAEEVIKRQRQSWSGFEASSTSTPTRSIESPSSRHSIGSKQQITIAKKDDFLDDYELV